MSYDATPEGGLPPPFGQPVTETAKLRLVPRLGSALTWLVGGVVSISHEVESGSRAGVAVLVLDVGGVDGQRVIALGRGQAGETADLVGRARDEADGDGAVDQVGAAVVGQGQGAGGERAQVDRLAECHFVG